jgi:hypothetical protein
MYLLFVKILKASLKNPFSYDSFLLLTLHGVFSFRQIKCYTDPCCIQRHYNYLSDILLRSIKKILLQLQGLSFFEMKGQLPSW